MMEPIESQSCDSDNEEEVKQHQTETSCTMRRQSEGFRRLPQTELGIDVEKVTSTISMSKQVKSQYQSPEMRSSAKIVPRTSASAINPNEVGLELRLQNTSSNGTTKSNS